MRIRILARAVCLAGGFLLGLQAWSQGQMEFKASGSDSVRKGGDSVRIIHILSTEKYRSETKDSVTNMLFLVGHVILKEGNTTIYCDSMVRNSRENTLQSFGHVHINDDSTDIYSDFMRYEVVKRTVYFQKNVKLTDGKGVLTTNELQYDLNSKIGVYSNGGKVVTKESVLTSQEGTYYEDTKDVLFKKKVLLKDPQYDLSADSLRYNTQTQVSTFITETYIVFKDSTHRTVRTSDGFYDLRNKKAQFGKRPVITDGTQRITGDDVQFDDSTGISTAKGNAIYRDTAQGVSVIANYMTSDKKKNTFLATDHPLMILKQDNDSIYIRADTLYSGSLLGDTVETAAPAVPVVPEAEKDSTHAALTRVDSLKNSVTDSAHARVAVRPDSIRALTHDTVITAAPTDSSLRYIRGYHHVRIFSDSLQAIGDSLYYSGKDSIFRLFKEPIAWGNGNYQVTGDTMFIYTRNKKADRLYVFENALAINKVGPNFYNQLKGNTINAYFKDGAVDHMRSKGNAESIYYVRDDSSAYTGVNKSHADIIDMYFLNKELHRVVLRSDVEGSMIPFKQVKFDEMRLRGFRWQEARRPKSKKELLLDPPPSVDESSLKEEAPAPDERTLTPKGGSKAPDRKSLPMLERPASDKTTPVLKGRTPAPKGSPQ